MKSFCLALICLFTACPGPEIFVEDAGVAVVDAGPQLDACKGLAQKFCTNLNRCQGPVDIALCELSFSKRCDDVAVGIESAHVKLDAAALSLCVASYEAGNCSTKANENCLLSILGSVPLGKRCRSNVECDGKGAAECVAAPEGPGTNTCASTCQLLKEGSSCTPGSNQCNSGRHCDSQTRSCKNESAPGSSCSIFEAENSCGPNASCSSNICTALPTSGPCTSQGRCGVGFFCRGNTCEAVLPENTGCNADFYCAPGLFCLNNLCKPKAALGAACTSSSQGSVCVDGARCIDAVCRKPKADGEACQTTFNAFDEESGENECLHACDRVLGKCASLKLAFSGSPCSQWAVCSAPEVCRFGVTEDGRATVGTCGMSQAGSHCSISNTPGAEACSPGQRCVPNTNQALAGTCAPLETGACLKNRDCKSMQTCNTAGQCVTPLAGTAGQACLPDALFKCTFGLTCVGGMCRTSGQPGNPCKLDGSCEVGACTGDGLTGGVCGAPRTDGSNCRSNTECESSSCVNKVCRSICQ
jgi:hypothetical protein